MVTVMPQRPHRSARATSRAPPDGNRVLDEGSGVVAAECPRERPAEGVAAQGADDGAGDAREQSAPDRPTRRWIAAPQRAPVAMRAPNCTGTVRRGVEGS